MRLTPPLHSALAMLSAVALGLTACGGRPDRPSPMTRQIRDAFKAADTNGDEQLTPEEFANLPLKGVKFEELDTDGNGSVTLAELQNYLIWRRVQADALRPIDRDGTRPRY